MPRNKKTRRPYRQRPKYLYGHFHPKEEIALVQSSINSVGLAFESCLARGVATDVQMYSMLVLYNWMGVILAHRPYLLDGFEEETREVHRAAGAALSGVIGRKNSGASSGYVARGNELGALRAAFDEYVPFLKEAVAETPEMCVREYMYAKELMREGNPDPAFMGEKDVIGVFSDGRALPRGSLDKWRLAARYGAGAGTEPESSREVK